jgi:L-threonylcarbamoyladenylate synthase
MKTRPFFSGSADDRAQVVRLLRQGALVALPTETVYGLAADALNVAAVAQIFAVKGRPLIDPLIVHVLDLEKVKCLAEVTLQVKALAEAFWPGPLTLVLPKKLCVPDLVTSGAPSVAIRVPAHPIFRAILADSALCLAAPSANPFGYVSPTRPEHVARTLGDRVPHIVDGGPCEYGLESTILSLMDPQKPTILRPGPLGAAALEAILQLPVSTKQEAIALDKVNEKNAFIMPGQLKEHYSPETPLYLCDAIEAVEGNPQVAYVFWKRPSIHIEAQNVYWLTEQGSVKEAAHHCYDLLQKLDALGYEKIVWELPLHNDPLYEALKNRMLKAAAKFQSRIAAVSSVVRDLA